MSLQKRVVLLLLQPPRSVRTFLVPSAHVARSRLTLSLGFGAFQSDNITGHNSVTDQEFASMIGELFCLLLTETEKATLLRPA